MLEHFLDNSQKKIFKYFFTNKDDNIRAQKNMTNDLNSRCSVVMNQEQNIITKPFTHVLNMFN